MEFSTSKGTPLCSHKAERRLIERLPVVVEGVVDVPYRVFGVFADIEEFWVTSKKEDTYWVAVQVAGLVRGSGTWYWATAKELASEGQSVKLQIWLTRSQIDRKRVGGFEQLCAKTPGHKRQWTRVAKKNIAVATA